MVLAAAALLCSFPVFFVLRCARRASPALPRILIIDTSNSYHAIKTKAQEQSVIQRDLDGFFEKVYTLYPVLGANPIDEGIDFPGQFRFLDFLPPRHVFIESKIAFSDFLRRLPLLNFIFAQINLLLRMRRLILAEGIAVIRGCEPFLTGLQSLVLSWLTARPYAIRIGSNFDLLHESGDIHYRKIFRWYFVEQLIARLVLPRAAAVFAANENYRGYAVKNGARPQATVVTRFGNVLDPLHFAAPGDRRSVAGDYGLSTGQYALYIGRLTRIKGVTDLIHVAAEIRKTRPDFKIALAGDGDIRNELMDLARTLAVCDNVVFLGNVRQEALASLLATAAAYVCPHSGRSLVEAALAGIPLVAYDWEWHSELVINGVTGILAPYRNHAAMANGLLQILSNPGQASAMGRRARELALDMMDQKKIQSLEKEKYTELFGQVAGRRTARSQAQ
jgi:glycosyltransferase involved in cell wall biosynthesis